MGAEEKRSTHARLRASMPRCWGLPQVAPTSTSRTPSAATTTTLTTSLDKCYACLRSHSSSIGPTQACPMKEWPLRSPDDAVEFWLGSTRDQWLVGPTISRSHSSRHIRTQWEVLLCVCRGRRVNFCC